MPPNRRHRIGGRSARRLTFGAGWGREVTRWMGHSRPRCAGQLTNAYGLSMRPYRTDGFSARLETSGG